MKQSSGIGVLDKSVVVMDAVAASPASLAELVTRTGLPRATAYRLAVALECHGLLVRDGEGRWAPGPRLAGWAHAVVDPLLSAAPAVLSALRDATDESAQLYRREGSERVCVAAAERATGLRDTVPVGSRLPLTAGSAAQVLLAWHEDTGAFLPGARFSEGDLAAVRRRGWAASIAEREPGVASVSAPVWASVQDRGPAGGPERLVVAAVSLSGPAERFASGVEDRLAPAVVAAASELGISVRKGR